MLNALDCTHDGEAAEPQTTEAEVEAEKDTERLKSKLSKTSLVLGAAAAKKPKGKS